jgi:hypothetical protein
MFVVVTPLFTPVKVPVFRHFLYAFEHSAESPLNLLQRISASEHEPWHPCWAQVGLLDATYAVAPTAIVRLSASSTVLIPISQSFALCNPASNRRRRLHYSTTAQHVKRISRHRISRHSRRKKKPTPLRDPDLDQGVKEDERNRRCDPGGRSPSHARPVTAASFSSTKKLAPWHWDRNGGGEKPTLGGVYFGTEPSMPST